MIVRGDSTAGRGVTARNGLCRVVVDGLHGHHAVKIVVGDK